MVGPLKDEPRGLTTGLSNYLRNSGWLLSEHLLRMATGLLVGIQIARHLGPSGFGQLNYALAVVALVAPVARLGLDAIMVKRLVHHPADSLVALGTVFRLKLVAAVTGIVAIALLSQWISPDPVERLCLVVIIGGLLFQATDVLDFLYQARFMAGLTSVCRMVALLLSAMVKLALVWLEAGLAAFAFAVLFEQALLAGIYAAAHTWRRDGIFPGRFDSGLARLLLVEARPLLISGVVVAVYTRIDQIFLRNLLGAGEAGLYAAATNLSEASYFLPLLFASAAFPVMVAMQQEDMTMYVRYRRLLYRSLLLGAAAIALLGATLAPVLIPFLYGTEFVPAARVFSIHLWTLVFVAYSAVFTRILIAQGRQSLVLKLTLVGLTANLAGLWFMTSVWGIIGAALAALLGHAAISATLWILHSPARDDFFDAIGMARTGIK